MKIIRTEKIKIVLNNLEGLIDDNKAQITRHRSSIGVDFIHSLDEKELVDIATMCNRLIDELKRLKEFSNEPSKTN